MALTLGRETVRLLAAAVRETDADVRDAVLIGSAVHAPDLARDYDMVVTTRARREEDARLTDALSRALGGLAGGPVDIVLRHPGDDMGDLALAILAGLSVVGDGETRAEAREWFERRGGATNSFREARSYLKNAAAIMKLGDREASPSRRLAYRKVAFDGLFDAARIAALTYLGREDGRWGGVASTLPDAFGPEFREMIATLHIRYGYEGRLPSGDTSAEFRNWLRRVEAFVRGLAALAREDASGSDGNGPGH